MKYIIEGGKKLKGSIKLSGNKNSVLPCMAAALLTSDEVILENIPQITDVDVFVEIFKRIGVKVEKGDSLKIHAKKIILTTLPDDLVKKLRASILLVGPILSREGKVTFTFPGGDIIGKRSIDTHIKGFENFGAASKDSNSNFTLSYNKKIEYKNKNIFLEEASVTATENLIMASVCGKNKVIISNAATEPHVIDLCKLLLKMGAKIEGMGTNRLNIVGVDKLYGTKFRISEDHIQFGTYAIAAVVTRGKIKIVCDKNTDLDPIIFYLSKFGINFKAENKGFVVSCDKLVGVDKVITNVWPGFPTDLMSQTIVLATQAEGLTLCHDWMFENRMFFVKQLIKMGANIKIADPHRVFVSGLTKLFGRSLESVDIRAGMALVIASLISEGKSIIDKAETIGRGYEDVIGKFSKLGASIREQE